MNEESDMEKALQRLQEANHFVHPQKSPVYPQKSLYIHKRAL